MVCFFVQQFLSLAADVHLDLGSNFEWIIITNENAFIGTISFVSGKKK